MKGWRGWLAAGLTVSALISSPVRASEFSVAPVRLELNATLRSGALVVRNDSQESIGFQVDAMEWTQDAQGADRYTSSNDLIFFPKILSVEPGQESVIRVGARKPVVQAEKTYRLFIQEMPKPNALSQATGPGAQVSLLLRFGAPIFVTPVQATDDAELQVASLDKGVLKLSAHNTGNRHQVIEGIHLRGLGADGKELYAMTLADRYLLAGTTKAFSTTLDAATCRALASIEVTLKTDRLSRVRKLDVSRADCP
ncbi:molecular chaperone [Ramlibacter aquaticus]|uniref:Molecular chaperone n=1 Tax=Ramlibacter aquaticus TaxID=2780094 RepID=A0ABR9SCW1_9BURK|nr:fimbria/pilus periplasmic chaperone [Ramlibacter aquaticus]MBE7939694.1 molecular chaperone [Ramlibacter aquaticus]